MYTHCCEKSQSVNTTGMTVAAKLNIRINALNGIWRFRNLASSNLYSFYEQKDKPKPQEPVAFSRIVSVSRLSLIS